MFAFTIRLSRFSPFCTILLLLLLSGAKVLAQQKSEEPPTANLYVWLDAPGTATVVLSASKSAVSERFFSTNWMPLLSRALGAQCNQAGDTDYSQAMESNRYVMAKSQAFGSRPSLLTRSGQIDPAPLLPALHRLGFVWLTINLMPVRLPIIRVKGANEEPYEEQRRRYFYHFVSTSAASPPLVRYTVGYPRSWEYRIPGVYALLLLPVLLTLWARSRALQAEKAAEIDPAVVWFGYSRFLQWLATGTWILWIGALITFQIHALLSFILDGSVFSRWFGLTIWLQYLPAPILVGCSALSHPVFARLRGLDLSRADLVRRAVWGQARLFAFACFGIAVLALDIDTRLSMMWVMAGIASLVVASQAAMKALGMTPQALSMGELRDRIFALSKSAGVKVQQIYVLPAGKGRTANAFAASGNRVLLTDYLLQHLSKREVDAVVAHELTHLKRRHPRALSLLVLAMFVGANAALAFLSIRGYAEALIALSYIGIMAMGLFLTYFFSRRFEWVADAGAVALTGDPEACISGLTKISRLNMMPLQWGKVAGHLLTHPTTLRRVEAIARQGNVPVERLQELLLSSQELPASPLPFGECYPLPKAHDDATAFSTRFKNSVLQRLFWSVLLVTSLIPALVALWTRRNHLEGGALWATYGLGLGVTFFARRIISEVINVRAYRQVEQKLHKKFSFERQLPADEAAIIPPRHEAFYVGLSPAASPRLYENFYDWDTGFVWFEADALIYQGEQARFGLRREHLLQVETRAHTLDWWNWQRVYITWRAGEAEGTFYVRPGANGSQRASRHASQNFTHQLESWRSQVPMDGAEDESGLSPASEGTPHFGEVTSQSPKAVCSAANIFVNLVLHTLVAFCICVLCGLAVQHGQTEGWYVLAVSILGLFFSLLPIYRYREPKVAQKG